MVNDNLESKQEQTLRIDPTRFPATPPLSSKQVERLTDAVDACERGEVIDGDEFLDQLSD